MKPVAVLLGSVDSAHEKYYATVLGLKLNRIYNTAIHALKRQWCCMVGCKLVFSWCEL